MLFSVSILLSSNLHAQNDSLQGESYEELIQLYESELFKNALDAKSYAIRANQKAHSEENAEKIAWSTYYIAYANSYIPAHKEALVAVDKALELALQIKDNLLLFKGHNLKGNILSDNDKEFEALDQYEIAKKYAELTSDPLNTIVANVNVAFIKKIHKDHEEAIQIYKENLAILDQLNTTSPKKETYKKQILFNIADSYLRIKKPNDAKKYNDEALKICDPNKSTAFYYLLQMNEAIINYQHQKYDVTIAISENAANYYKSIDNEAQLIAPYLYLGKSNFQLENYEKAIPYLEQLNDIIERNKIAYSDQQEAYEILYKCYNKLGNHDVANNYFESYLALDKKTDSIDLSVNNKIHQEHDIVPLKEEINQLDNVNQQQQKRAVYLYYSLLLLMLVLIAFVIWNRQRRQKDKQRFKELMVAIQKLEESKEKSNSTTISAESPTPVTDENALQILNDLKTFEEKKLYLRQDCTLGYVAKKLKTNTTYLSSVINTYKEKSFKVYLTELRINEALIQLKNDAKLRSYTIKAIAEEFGFKRSETFSRAFKSQTGIYPSSYIKSLQNQDTIK